MHFWIFWAQVTFECLFKFGNSRRTFYYPCNNSSERGITNNGKICIIQTNPAIDAISILIVYQKKVSFQYQHTKDTIQKLSIYWEDFTNSKVVPQELKTSEAKTIFDYYISLSRCKRAIYYTFLVQWFIKVLNDQTCKRYDATTNI